MNRIAQVFPTNSGPHSAAAPVEETISVMNRYCENPHNLVMKAVIVYDHVVFAARVGSVLRRVGGRAGVQVEWATRCWPVKALNDSVLAKKALLESQDAHLVVLPARYARAVPTRLFNWLEEWAERREIGDAALGFTAEPGANPPQPVCSELYIFIRQHGLHLITGQGLTTQHAIRINVELSADREAPVFIRSGRRRTANHTSTTARYRHRLLTVEAGPFSEPR